MFKFFQKERFDTEILGINERNVAYVYSKNPRKYFPLADDKVLCKEVLHKAHIACAETYGVIERIGDILSIWQTINHHSTLAIKPANGSGGGVS